MKRKHLTAIDVWTLALTDDMELRGREVWHRDQDSSPDEPMSLTGVLAENVTEAKFWEEVADGYSK